MALFIPITFAMAFVVQELTARLAIATNCGHARLLYERYGSFWEASHSATSLSATRSRSLPNSSPSARGRATLLLLLGLRCYAIAATAIAVYAFLRALQ